jgi:hypothetical protein
MAFPRPSTPTLGRAAAPAIPAADVRWIDDALPASASVTAGQLIWDTSQSASGTQSLSLTAPASTTRAFVKFMGSDNPFVSCGMVVVAMATIGGAIALMIIATRTVSVRVPIEMEQGSPLYWEVCGARLNWLNVTAPFARIAVYAGLVVIRVPGRMITLNRSEIETVTIVGGLFTPGVQIRHHAIGAPARITIWSGSPSRLCSTLESGT